MAGGGAEPPRATTPERAPASHDPWADAPRATTPERAPDEARRAAYATTPPRGAGGITEGIV